MNIRTAGLGPVPLKTVLYRSAEELEKLAVQASEIDELMGHVLIDAEETPAATLKGRLAQECQKIDLLRQSIQDVVRFVTALADSLDASIPSDATRAVSSLHLRDLALRLSSPEDAELAEQEKDAGGLHLF